MLKIEFVGGRWEEERRREFLRFCQKKIKFKKTFKTPTIPKKKGISDTQIFV